MSVKTSGLLNKRIMSERKTVLVVGAGASNEVNIPIGKDLTKYIAKYLNIRQGDVFSRRHPEGDHLIREAIDEHARKNKCKLEHFYTAAAQIRDTMPFEMSIDNFIDTHQGNKEIELCGKLAIVRAILEAEKHSEMSFDDQTKRQNLTNTWYTSFAQLLTEDCRLDGLQERLSSITFIIFNYDRCVEHFLFNYFQIHFLIPDGEAAKFIDSIEIYHPYGKVGHLPWQLPHPKSGLAIDFGEIPDSRKLLSLSYQIKTFTEGTDPESSEINDIKKRLREADIVLFLGFSFWKQNLELLESPPHTDQITLGASYYATGLEMYKSECEKIKTALKKLNGKPAKNIELDDAKCHVLFQHYWRSLSFRWQPF